MVQDVDLDQVFLGVIHSFGNSIGDFVGFAEAVTYNAFAISDHHDGAKAEATTTFYHFGYTLDFHHALFQFYVAAFDPNFVGDIHSQY